MKYTPNDLDTGNVITNVAVDNWDAGLVSANNPDRSDMVDSYTEINTLGADTVVCSGRLVAESQGLSDVNLADDDDAGFEVTTGWTDSGGTSTNDTANKLEGTNCRKFTLSGSSGFTYKDFLAKLDITKYYLFTMHLKNGDATNCYLAVNCVGDAGLLNNTGYAGTTYTRQGIAIQPSDFDTATEVRAQLIAIGANAEFVYAGTLMIQEITAEEYNAEVDPENVITLLKKYDYHRELGSCEGVRVKSVGKNLFNKEDVTANVQTDNTDGTETASVGEYASHYIKIDDGDDIFISGCDNTANTDGAYYNFNKEYISGFTAYGALTIPTNATYFRYTIDYDDLDTAQVEKNTSATAYESYKESISYTPRVLRSVPNGTRDSYRHNDGVDTQRCEEYTLLSGDIDSVANGTNLQRVNIGVDALDGLITQTGGTITGEIVISGTIGETTGNDIAGDDYKFTAGATLISMLFPLGTYADVAAARTALTSTVTTKIVYELATPVVTYHPENIVNGYPDGTVYHEKAVEEVLTYDNGLVASNSDLLIDSMDYAYKIDTTTNVETPIDLDNIVDNGVQYTLLSGDIDSLVTSGSNVDYVTIGLDAFSVVKTQTSGIDGSFAIPNYNTETIVALDTAGNEQKFRTTATILYLMFTKGTYADIAAARVALAGLKLVYESTSKTDTIGIIGASVGELYRFAYYYFGAGTRGLASYGYCQNSKDESEGNTEGLKELNNKVNAVSEKVNLHKNGWEFVSSSTLTADSSQVDIDIPAYATEFLIVAKDLQASSTTDRNLTITFNSDSAANYIREGFGVSGIAVTSPLLASNGSYVGYVEIQASNTAFNKTFYVKSFNGGALEHLGCAWNDTTLVNTVNIIPTTDDINEGAIFTLYIRRVVA